MWALALSLAAHLLITLMVFSLLRRLTRSDWAAVAGMAWFGVHAMNFYITYDATFLPDFCLGFLGVASLLLYSRGMTWLSLLFFAGALLSKEAAIMLPVGLSVVAYLRSERRWLMGLIPHYVLAACCTLPARAPTGSRRLRPTCS